MKKLTIALLVTLLGTSLFFTGCSKKEKTIGGIALGAAAGGLIGSAAGGTEGGIIGAVAGGTLGGVIGHNLKDDEKKDKR